MDVHLYKLAWKLEVCSLEYFGTRHAAKCTLTCMCLLMFMFTFFTCKAFVTYLTVEFTITSQCPKPQLFQELIATKPDGGPDLLPGKHFHGCEPGA